MIPYYIGTHKVPLYYQEFTLTTQSKLEYICLTQLLQFTLKAEGCRSHIGLTSIHDYGHSQCVTTQTTYYLFLSLYVIQGLVYSIIYIVYIIQSKGLNSMLIFIRQMTVNYPFGVEHKTLPGLAALSRTITASGKLHCLVTRCSSYNTIETTAGPRSQQARENST